MKTVIETLTIYHFIAKFIIISKIYYLGKYLGKYWPIVGSYYLKDSYLTPYEFAKARRGIVS